MDHIGIDVHKRDGQICILTEDGELLERRVRTESSRFAEILGPRPRARILLESATESEWVARCVEGLERLPGLARDFGGVGIGCDVLTPSRRAARSARATTGSPPVFEDGILLVRRTS